MKQPSIVSNFRPVLANIKKTVVNGTTMYFLNDKACDLIKIEWVFHSGTTHQSKSLQANFAANLMLEGTEELDSLSFSRKLDELGAYFNAECGRDFTTFTLHVMSIHLEAVLQIIAPVFQTPAFSEKEFEVFHKESKEDFEQNLHNGGFIARQSLRKKLYQNHSYGRVATLSSFDALSNEDVINFAKQQYIAKDYTLFVSGKITALEIAVLSKQLNQTESVEYRTSNKLKLNCNPQVGLHHEYHKTSKQDSVRIGFNTVSQNSKEFLQVNIINTILGGYFGSRLMQNIREEKGWTYGINSSILPGELMCSAFISADVLDAKGKDCLLEINKEIEKLRNTAITKEEFNRVSAYLNGSVLRSFDGVFEQMDRFQSTYLNELPTEHYLEYLDLLNTVTMEELQHTAQEHFNPANQVQVIASSKK